MRRRLAYRIAKTRLCAAVGHPVGPRNAKCQWHHHPGKHAEHEHTGQPAKAADHPLRDQRHHHLTKRTARAHDAKREAAPLGDRCTRDRREDQAK